MFFLFFDLGFFISRRGESHGQRNKMPTTIISHFDFMTRVYKQGVASAWLTQAHKGRERRSSFRRITMRWKKQVGAQKPATSASYAPARDSACGRFPGMLRGCCGVHIYIYISLKQIPTAAKSKRRRWFSWESAFDGKILVRRRW